MKKYKVIFILILICSLLVSCTQNVDISAGENLVGNGDFDSEDVSKNWKENMWISLEGYSQTSIISNGYSGSSLMIENNEANDTYLSQEIAVNGNETYKISGYIKAESIIDGQGANLSFINMFVYTPELFDTNSEWKYVEIYGKTAYKQETLTLLARVGGYGALSQGRAYFDNIILEKVDEAPSGKHVYELKETEPKAQDPEEDDGFKFLMPTVLLSMLFILLFFLFKKSLLDNENDLTKNKHDHRIFFYAILFIGLVIRITLAVSVRGYPNDISCWRGWASHSADVGLLNLYNGDVFIDYPPGYMYVLYIVGLFMKIPASLPANVAWLCVKLPSIITDVLVTIIIYKLASEKSNTKMALVLSSFYFLNPAIILNSSAWGQIDSVLALMVIFFLLSLYKRKYILAGISLGVGVLLKTQMILFAPIYITATILYARETSPRKAIVEFFKGVGAGIGAFIIIILPFVIKYGLPWIIQLYVNILTSYESVSLNACNMWALIGAMWKNVNDPFLFMTYNTWGYIGMAFAVIVFFVIAIKDKKKENIFLHGAILIIGIFLFSGKMHERYMYPAIALLALSYIFTKKRSHLYLFCLFTVTQFANSALVLANLYIFSGDWWTFVISLTTIIGYIAMIWFAIGDLMGKKDFFEEYALKVKEDEGIIDIKTRVNKRLTTRINKPAEKGLFATLGMKDYIIIASLTIIYAAIALVNLGNTQGPQEMYNASRSNESVIVDFGEDVNVGSMMYFRAQATNGAIYKVEYASENDPDNFECTQYLQIINGGDFEGESGDIKRDEIRVENNMPDDGIITFSDFPAIFKWYTMEYNVVARYAKITVVSPMIRLVEVGFKDIDGNVIDIISIKPIDMENPQDAQLLFDEQDTIPQRETYMNSTYFDEIYHAGTAFEHMNRYEPYETTHPPLGKVIMSWGIQIFGMTPFGWRIMGTIIGILMIPAMYLLAMMIFKSTKFASVATVMLTFDFMHFTQTRIATIDSYGVLFIILMFLSMGIYFKMSFYTTDFKKTLIPLFFSGLFFGMGAASKWICLYAGAGLAIIFFYSLFRRYMEFNFACSEKGEILDAKKRKFIKDKFIKYILITLAFCVLFFVVIPTIVYVASYIPYLEVSEFRSLDDVWQNQVNMYNYHSSLSDDHPYASPWYEWPFIIKPMWYYFDSFISGTGQMSSIAAFGNPAVWWIGTICTIWFLICMFFRKENKPIHIFILLALATQYVPWMLVPRSMFIYHFFASVPFIIIITVIFIKTMQEKYKFSDVWIFAYMALVVALFVMFYPVLSGATVSSEYGSYLKWLGSWWFTY